jgi:hypothetical protein
MVQAKAGDIIHVNGAMIEVRNGRAAYVTAETGEVDCSHPIYYGYTGVFLIKMDAPSVFG